MMLVPVPALLSHLPSVDEDLRLSLLTLDADSAHILHALSIFRGSWTLEAAQAICTPTLTMLRLHSPPLASYVIREESASRYRLAGDVLEFYRQQPIEVQHYQSAHFRYFGQLVQEAREAMYRDPDPAWIERLSLDQADIMAAYAHATGNAVLDFALGLWRWHYERHSYADGESMLMWALACADDHALQTSECYRALGMLAKRQGDLLSAQEFFETGLQCALYHRNRPEIANIHNQFAQLACDRSQWMEAEAAYQAALTVWREEQDIRGQAATLNNLGTLYLQQDLLERAQEALSQSGSLFKQLGDSRRACVVYSNLGIVSVKRRHLSHALQVHTQCLRLATEINDKILILHTLNNLGDVHTMLKQFNQSRECYAGCYRLAEEIGYIVDVPILLIGVGMLMHAQSNHQRAVVCFSTAETLSEQYPLTLSESWKTRVFNARSAARRELSAAKFKRLESEGRRMNLDQAMSFLQECVSGDV